MSDPRNQVWWLILCVNLTGLRDAQSAGKALFLGSSCKGVSRGNSLSLPTLIYASSLSTPLPLPHLGLQGFGLRPGVMSSASLVLKSSDLDWILPLSLLSLHPEDSRAWDFLASTVTWADSYRKSLSSVFMCICASLWPMCCSQAPLSPGKNTGVGCHALLQGNLPNPGIEPRSSALQVDSLPSEPPGKPKDTGVG